MRIFQDITNFIEDIAELQTKLSEARQQGGNDARQRNEVFHYIMNHLKKKNIVQGKFTNFQDTVFIFFFDVKWNIKYGH